MKRTPVFLAVIAITISLAFPAASAETGWHLRIAVVGFDPSLDETVPAENPEEVRVTGDSDLGFGASLEYQFSPHWGVEAGVMKGGPDVRIRGEIAGYGDLVLSDTMPTVGLTLDVNFHLTPQSPAFDLYVGAGIARMSYNDLRYEIEETTDSLGVRVGNDTAWTAKAGLDIALGEGGWAAFGGLRWVDSRLVVSNTDDLPGNTETFDFGLFNFSVGLAYSF